MRNFIVTGIVLGLILLGFKTVPPEKEKSFPPLKMPAAFIPNKPAGFSDSLTIAQQYFKNKDYQKALEVGLKVLEKAEKNQNDTLVLKTSYLLGTIFDESHNYEKALEYYYVSKSLLLPQNQSQVNLFEKIYLRISRNQHILGNTDSAIYYSEKILNLNNQNLEGQKTKVKVYNNLASFYLEKKDLKKAKNLAIKSLGYKNLIGKDSMVFAYTYTTLGNIYLQQNNYNQAKQNYLKAYELIKNQNGDEVLNLKEAVYDNLAWSLYKLKDYQAYEYQEKSIDIRDSIRDAEVSGILAEMEGKFNADAIKKHEQLKTAEEQAKRMHSQSINTILTIILGAVLLGSYMVYHFFKLRQTNLKLEQQHEVEQLEKEGREKILNATIDGKESERKMIAETLHHSVSSLLSSANLHLQASKAELKSNTPEEIIKAQKIINEASQKIRNLSHSLVSSVLLKFGLEHAIQEMCDKYTNSQMAFNATFKNIKRYEPNFELKINSIIDELLNNIIKHSKATISEVILVEENKHLNITIKDNGQGFVHSRKIKSNGLGLAQVEARINKMNGYFEIDSSKQRGTRVYISVPVVEDIKTVESTL